MDLILEIGTEEIPAKFIPASLSQLEVVAKNKFTELGIPFTKIKTAGTPRRLTLFIDGVALKQNDKHTETKGPSVKIAFDANGDPTKVALGFAKKQGLSAGDLVAKDGYVYAVVKEKGREVKELLPDILPALINSLTFPKTMRWGSLDLRFVRPIRHLLALCDNTVVPFAFAEVTSGNFSSGHRFLGQKKIEINSAGEYWQKLEDNFVITEPERRREIITEQIQKLAAQAGGTAAIDEALLEEVVYLVEYPTAILGRFEEKYLALPPEAIITPMREHQRYFPVKDTTGKLLPVFITVRCGNAEHLDIVRHGNERVLRARLADARFFFEEDQKTPLPNRVEALKNIVFQEGLGSIYDKTMRLVSLAQYLGQILNAAPKDLETAKRGAYLAKADLSTNLVGEFSELQGIMGREYALLNGEAKEVAQTIYEHYLPRFAGDSLARSAPGRIAGIADKIDNIAANFSRGLIPTGSQDPYALRRQALGIVHTLIDAEYSLSLAALLGEVLTLLAIKEEKKRQELSDAIAEFFRGRLKNVLTDKNISYDVIDAALVAGTDDIYDAYLRAAALADFIAQNKKAAVPETLQALKRVGNLVKQVKNPHELTINPALFETDAEKALYKTYNALKEKCGRHIAAKQYVAALEELVNLTEPVNDFFNSVMVMVEDAPIKQNRLALLCNVTCLSLGIADLNKLV